MGVWTTWPHPGGLRLLAPSSRRERVELARSGEGGLEMITTNLGALGNDYDFTTTTTPGGLRLPASSSIGDGAG